MKIEVICGLVAVIVYLNAFGADFVYDDSRAIMKNRDVRWETPLYEIFFNDFWGTRMTHSGSHKSYRPITVLTFRFNYAISGLHPWSYHVANVILHAMTSSLFVYFAKTRMFKAKNGVESLFAGLLFASHPIHTESVTGVVGRADVLAGFFVLMTLLSYTNYCDHCDEDGTKHVMSSRGEEQDFPSYSVPKKRAKSKNKPEVKKKLSQVPSAKRTITYDTSSRKDTVTTISRSKDNSCTKWKANEKEELDFAQKQKNTVEMFFMKIIPCLPYFFSICALLSKEQGASALPLCAIYDVWIKRDLGFKNVLRILFFQNEIPSHHRLQKRIWKLTSFTILSVAVRIFLWSLFTEGDGTTLSPSFSPSDNPAASSDSFLVRTLTFNYLLAFNMWLLICPVTLSYDWSMDAIPLIETIVDCRNAYTLAFYVCSLMAGMKIVKAVTERDQILVKRHNIEMEATCHTGRFRADGYIESNNSEKIGNRRSKLQCQQTCPNGDSCVDIGLTIECRCLRIEHSHPEPHCFQKINNNRCSSEENINIQENRSSSVLHFKNDLVGIETSKARCKFHFPATANSEHTNSSGYATESSVEDLAEILLEDCPSSKIAFSPTAKTSESLHDDTGSVSSVTSVETITQGNVSIKLAANGDHRDASILIMSLAIMTISFLPATNLFFFVGFVVAERLLYIPSMGYCILLSYGMSKFIHAISTSVKNEKIRERSLALVKSFMVILLIAYSFRTFQRNGDWKNEFNLYHSGVRVSPAKSWANLGNVLKTQNRPQEAEYAYLRALEHRSNMADVHYNLGLLYQESRRFTDAVRRYDKAILHRPRLAVAHLNKAIVLAKLGMVKEAEKIYRHITTIDDFGLKDPQGHARAQVSALYNLGCLLMTQDRYHEAVCLFKEATNRRNTDYEPHSLFNMLGQGLFKLNEFEEAEKWFLASMSSKRNHVPTYLAYARLLNSLSRHDEVIKMYQNALLIEPRDHVIYNHFGKYYTDNEEYQKAAEIMLQALESRSGRDDFETLMIAANSFRHARLYSKAEECYRRTTVLRPKSEIPHINLGAILHMQGKYEEARLSYHEALKIEPNDSTANQNLAKLEDKIRNL